MRTRSRGQRLRSRIGRTAIGALLSILGAASIAHAHGGMAGPDEIGPPLLTSAALGFACYWLVILWPSSKPKDNGPPTTGRRSKRNRRGGRSLARKNGEAEHLSPVTKVAGRGRS
jgi:hypothetical protein